MDARDDMSCWDAAKRVLLVLGLGLMLYTFSAVPVSVLAKWEVIPTKSASFRVLVRFYDPLFSFMSHIPGADDAFVRITDAIARLHP